MAERIRGNKRDRGSNLTPEIEGLVIRTALEDLRARGDVADFLVNAIGNMGIIPPSVNTLKKMVSKARNPDSPSPLDTPWSLGYAAKPALEMNVVPCSYCNEVISVLTTRNDVISPEATGDLLLVWKFCLVIGHKFTIREAKWVSRIRTAIPDKDLETYKNIYSHRAALLFGYAYEYSIRERVSEVLKKPMDTTDIDGELSFLGRDWEWIIFRALGLIPRFTIDTTMYKKLSGFTPLPLFINTVKYATEEALKGWNRRDYFDYENEAHQHLPSELFENQEYMFAALLLYLSKGPSWNKLTKEKFLSVLDYLTDLVKKELVDDLDNFTAKIVFENLDVSSYRDRPKGLAPEDVLSEDVLKLVGYEIKAHEATIDNPYPHLKDYQLNSRYKAKFTLD